SALKFRGKVVDRQSSLTRDYTTQLNAELHGTGDFVEITNSSPILYNNYSSIPFDEFMVVYSSTLKLDGKVEIGTNPRSASMQNFTELLNSSN
ncbi:hypothetical protein NPIL_197101, partial [Nephila pilipes]